MPSFVQGGFQECLRKITNGNVLKPNLTEKLLKPTEPMVRNFWTPLSLGMRLGSTPGIPETKEQSRQWKHLVAEAMQDQTNTVCR